MKIVDPVLLSLSMRGNKKCNISHAPPSTGLSGIQFSILKVLQVSCNHFLFIQRLFKFEAGTCRFNLYITFREIA